MRGMVTIVIGALVVVSGCSPGRHYELRGQVLAVDAGRQEVTIKHDDIRGFMPAMTMPFKVRDPELLAGRSPGELVRATLVVEEDGAFLASIERTGRAPLMEVPPPRADILQPGDEAPDLAYVDSSGARRRLSEWRGRTVAVTFIYTRCPLPDFCPLMDRHFATVQKAIAKEARLQGGVRLLSVSFDPDFDTPAVLAAHAARVQADPAVWVFATGSRDDIDRFASRFGVSIVRNDGSSEIVHNLRTAVIDPAGRIATILSGNDWTPAALLAALRQTSPERDRP